jgi:hypothetical protein
MKRCILGILLLTGTSLLLGAQARTSSEIVIAIRYLQAEGTSHPHLYREDGKLLRQLTTPTLCCGASMYRPSNNPGVITLRRSAE